MTGTPVLVVHAHPHPDRSIACRALLEAVRGAPGVAVHALYDRYPDYAIDVAAERTALAAARLLVWLHPLYWYSAPSLLKLWCETVLGSGWAYGAGGTALVGKSCLWAVTTGAPAESYAPGAEHDHPFEAFVPVMRQTAAFCGMRWLPPLVLHGAHRVDPAQLATAGRALRERLVAFTQAPVPGGDHG
jgi:glutathione-regulated potassium-efflux system ancillary protein KefF